MNNRVVVSAIIERNIEGNPHVYIQTRWKPTVSPAYSGQLEIPAGGVEVFESVLDALRREVYEETGLEITSIEGSVSAVRSPNGDVTQVTAPFVCQQTLSTKDGLPWVGLVFRCTAKGEFKIQQSEAKDPMWMSVSDLKDILESSPEKIFSLQLPVLQKYVEQFGG